MKAFLVSRLKAFNAGILKDFREAQIFQAASSLAYTTILSLIPLLAMSFAVFKAFGGMERLYATIEPFIISNLAEGASDEVVGRIKGFIENAHTSAVGLGGFFGLVFTSMSMLNNIENTINRIWKIREKRHWFMRLASYWLVITLGPVAFGVALGFATSSDLPLISHLLPSGFGGFLLSFLVFWLIYQIVPYCRVERRASSIAALVAAIFWALAERAFILYTHRVVTYSRIYGSLGAVPLLLLWIYIVWIIVLSGASITASLQRNLISAPHTHEIRG